MKLKINLKKEIPYFLLQNTIRLYCYVNKHETTCTCLLNFLSQADERNDSKLDALFDGYLPQEAYVTTSRVFYIERQPFTVRTTALPKADTCFFICGIAFPSIDWIALENSNLFKTNHSDEFWMVVEITEQIEFQISLVARNDRGIETTLIPPMAFEPNKSAEEMFEGDYKSDTRWQMVPFTLTGEPLCMSGQLLHSGTILSIPNYGVASTQYPILPSMYSDVLAGEHMSIDETTGLVRISMHKTAPPVVIDALTDKKVSMKYDDTRIFFDGLRQREDLHPSQLGKLIYGKFEKYDPLVRKKYDGEIPSHIFPWYHKLEWKKNFEMGQCLRLKGKVSENKKQIAPCDYHSFLSEEVSDNKFKPPLLLELMDVLPLLFIQESIKEKTLNAMILACIKKMYVRSGLSTDIWKDISFEENEMTRRLFHHLIHGEDKNNKKHFFSHYREEVMRKERLPDLYYPNIR